jgi:hypothetical protein
MFNSNASSADAGGVPYVEDVFSTYLYTGNGATQTITNNIDLSTKGGLVWLKGRSGATDHALYDTARGATFDLASNTSVAQTTQATGLTSFDSTGFSIGALAKLNTSAATYASWTFREQAKFFDVVTYTGNGTAGLTVSHNLGATPGVIIVKRTDGNTNWRVYHRSLGATQYLDLDGTDAATTATTIWNDTAPTSTVFSVGTNSGVNASGGTYIAYLFAHDAGGFGLNGTDNVISCGSFTTDGSGNATVSLGYEPQWLMIKKSSAAQNWNIFDSMRGMPVGSADSRLFPNSSAAEDTSDDLDINATGFSIKNNAFGASATCIYIAIRRGPMKVPTTGTSVFTPVARSGTGATATVSNTITTDLIISMTRNTGQNSGVWDRLRGFTKYLATTSTAIEGTGADTVTAMNNTAYVLGADSATDRINRSGYTYANWTFSRAPSFFDEVCYTGNNTARTLNHNLGAVPELMIIKNREQATDWIVYSATLGATKNIRLNTTAAEATNTIYFNSTAPTSTVFSVGADGDVNNSTRGYVTYLFATCAGVSKVGSYTGTATTQTINCGFTAGARFVLIKRTDSTGDWYVWDSARGIIAGNDPYLLINSAAAEVTSTDYVDTAATGFELSSTAPAAINANGGTYIFLAIA